MNTRALRYSIVAISAAFPVIAFAQSSYGSSSYASSSSSYGYCGNYMCEADETIASCPLDCGSYSSSSYSSSSVSFDGYCGNNICDISEDIMTCPLDCGSYSSSSNSSSTSSSESSDSSSSVSTSSSEGSSDSSSSPASCGNWMTEGAEECDDGPLGSEECSVVCLLEYLCSCGCETSGGTQICAEERVPGNYCLNQQPNVKTKAACEAKTGSMCSGYEKGNVNNKLTGTMKACTWKKKVTSTSSSSETSSSSSDISAEYSSSSY